MNSLPSRLRQRGYLLEVPILIMVVFLVLAVLIPNLSPIGRKIALALAAIPILFGLYYMIVIPGWMPGDKSRLKPPWNLLAFLFVAALIVTVVVMVVIGN